MGKRVIIIKGDDTQTIWDCDLETMKSYGWVPVAEIQDESDEEIEDGYV
jgi:hypothetical protein